MSVPHHADPVSCGCLQSSTSTWLCLLQSLDHASSFLWNVNEVCKLLPATRNWTRGVPGFVMPNLRQFSLGLSTLNKESAIYASSSLLSTFPCCYELIPASSKRISLKEFFTNWRHLECLLELLMCLHIDPACAIIQLLSLELFLLQATPTICGSCQ